MIATVQLDGAARRDDALDMLAELRELYVLRARRALLAVLLERGTGTADDVRANIELPANIDPVCMGAVPLPLARAGIIERVGYVPTNRPTAHARPTALWQLTDGAAAEKWLAKNPDRPDDQSAARQTTLWS